MLKSCNTLISLVKHVSVHTRKKAFNAGVMYKLLLCTPMYSAWAYDHLNSVGKITLCPGSASNAKTQNWLYLQSPPFWCAGITYYRDCAVPYVRHFHTGYGIFHSDSKRYNLMLHWITMEYAVSRLKMPYIWDCAISVLSASSYSFCLVTSYKPMELTFYDKIKHKNIT